MRTWAHRIAAGSAKALRSTVLIVGWCALICAAARAQGNPDPIPVTLPAVKVGTAALITTSSGDAFFNTKRTVTATSLATLEGKASLPPPPEIVELARALKNDPDLIYEYVRNNIAVNWMYGLQKGPLGTLVDKSGTPFDQAALMIALLNQAGYAAAYQLGTITLSGTLFTAWTGVSDAKAACQMLANGGIPALINNVNSNQNCDSVASGSISTVQLSHAWVQVTIPNSACASQHCLFDPAYKTYVKWTGIDLASATQLGTGSNAPLSIATTGMQTGTLASGQVISNLAFNTNGSGSTPGLYQTLSTYSQNLLNYLYAQHLEAAHIEDVAGGGAIVPYVSPVGGLRQSSLPYSGSAVQHTTTCAVPATKLCTVPDVYRTTLHLQGWMWDFDCSPGLCPGPNAQYKSMFDAPFFADEIYGRAVTVDTDISTANYYKDYQAGPNRFTNTVTLHVDGVQIGPEYFEPAAIMGLNEHGFPIVGSTRGAPAYVTLGVDHPYAATGIAGNTTNNGGYMRDTVTKSVTLITALTVVAGFGDASAAYLAKLSDEKAGDSSMPLTFQNCPAEDPPGKCVNVYPGGTGDFEREKLAASWLAQYSRAAHLNAAIAGASYQLHHMIGVAYGDGMLSISYMQNPPIGENPDTPQVDNFNRIDVDSALSMQSRTADATKRRAAILAFAASAATLEGSAAAQMDDLPDSGSTATRFEWANSPPGHGYWDAPNTTSPNAYEDPGTPGARKFVQFTPANSSYADDVALVENHAASYYGSGCLTDEQLICGEANLSHQPTIDYSEAVGWSTAYAGEIGAYTQAGYSVVTSQETFLGPGQRASGDIHWLTGKDLNGNTTYGYYTHSPTKQRGPAFIATLYDATGVEPLAIAHDLVALGAYGAGSIVTKGGGAGGQPNQGTSYNPSEAGDILKSHFVDKLNLLGVNLSNGSFGYAAPAKLEVGNGGFPYALTAEFQWNPQPRPPAGAPPAPPVNPPPGWTTNWHSRLAMSGSGMEAMGASDVRAAVGTIATFLAAQSIYANAPSMARDVSGALAEAWWARQMSGNTVTAVLGTQSRQFLALPENVVLPDGSHWFAPGASYAKLGVTNARAAYEQKCNSAQQPGTPFAASRGWNYAGMSFDVTNAQGDVQHFLYWSNNYSLEGDYECGFAQGFRLGSWSFPQGVTVTLSYGNKIDYQKPWGNDGFEQLVSVSNNVARTIHFTTDGTLVTGFDNGLSGLDARSVALGDFTGYQTGGIAGSVTDPAQAKTSFTFLPARARSDTQRPVAHAQLLQVYTPDKPTKPNLQYNYDALGRVKEVVDAEALQVGDRLSWAFYIADGTRGERDDPLGEAWSVTYDAWGHPSRYVDERGYETDAVADNRGRVLQVQYPEDDCEAFLYDDRGNTTDYYRVDKASSCNTGAGASHVLHVSAQWDPAWNKPTQVTDANGNTTTLLYYPSGSGASLLETATRPADAAGNHPVYNFNYDAKGRVTDSYVPFAPAQTIRTHNVYDSGENLTSSVVDYGGLALTTSYTYEAQGDVATTKDPRNYLSESKYDNDRRPTYSIHHDGAVVSAAINAESRTIYDALGRETEQDAAKCFDTASPCLTSGSTVATWIATRTTAYTPTGKVASVTDADGGVTSTQYDGADRAGIVTDPVLRQTFYTYDPSGNVLSETRGRGTQDQAVYATYTYGGDGEKTSVTDAKGASHLVQFGYDGFNRLIATTYPDATADQVTLYDANGNAKTRVNRANETLSYTYDNLNRMLTKVSLNPVVTTSWTYFLNGAVDTVTDTALNTVDYGYDTAGRQNSAATTIRGLIGTKTVGYALDANGNRTKLTWPDGYYVGYCYDSLNRMTQAMENSTSSGCATSLLATYQYDPLSRRTSLAYGNGASMAYTYSPGGDVLTLNHDMSGAANDPHYTLTYSPAHQLASLSNTDTDYVWSPAAAGTDAYGAVNTLNQYPTITPSGASTKTLSYDAKGNLIGGNIASNGNWTFGYDAENRLRTAFRNNGAVQATYAYDPLGRRTRKSGVGVTETFFLCDGTDEIAEYSQAGTMTQRYVPGPAIDQPVARVTVAGGAKEYFHTNRQGSVIAMSDGTGAKVEGPFVYDSYGNGAPTTGEPYKFTGRRLDAETGLYFYRARYYWPQGGRFMQTDGVGFDADTNLYAYVGNDPTDKSDPTGRSGCADMSAQHLSGQCIDSTNFVPQDKKDSGGRVVQQNNRFARDAVGTPTTDKASAEHAEANHVVSGNEGMNRMDVTTDASGAQSVTFSPMEVTNAGPMGAQLKDVDEAKGAAAVEHPHILSNGASRRPGPGDWTVPAGIGAPNYVEQNGGSVVLEISGGQVRIRVISGGDLSRVTGEYQEAQKQLNQFQEFGVRY